jgi:GntR family transcriptional regulator
LIPSTGERCAGLDGCQPVGAFVAPWAWATHLVGTKVARERRPVKALVRTKAVDCPHEDAAPELRRTDTPLIERNPGDPERDQEPRHVALARTLREAITNGDLSPGERLPPERELADRFNASRTTVRLALSALKSQGLIGSGQGQGTYVRKIRPIRVMAMDQDRRAKRAENHAATFNTEIALQGRIGRQLITGVDREAAGKEVARFLGLPEGTAVLSRKRIMLVDDEPYQLGNSYYPFDLVSDTAIALPEPVEEGVLSVLERKHGKPISYYIDELSFRMPTPDESRLLELDAGVCVVRIVRIAYDEDEVALEAFEQLLAGDKHVLIYEVSA